MTYAPAKFYVATSNDLGDNAFTRKYIIWPWPWGSRSYKMLPSTLHIMWPNCTCKVWSYYIQLFRRICIYKKIHYLTLTQNVAQYPLHDLTSAPANFEVAMSKKFRRRCIYKKIHYLTLTFKVTQNFAQYPSHHVTYAPPKFEVAASNSLGGDALFDLDSKVIRNVAQFPLHHVIYAPAKLLLHMV